jgi:hypothetical protein
LATYQRILASGGFTIVELRPAICLLGNVIDTRRRIIFQVLAQYWALLCGIVGRRERLGRVVGAALRAVDLLATRVAKTGPSAKIIVARRNEPALARSL